MKTVTESIFDNGQVVIAMADVQHVEYQKHPTIGDNGIFVITKHTTYNREVDGWENPIYVGKDMQQSFLTAWCTYRNELEGNITITELQPETVLLSDYEKLERQDELNRAKIRQLEASDLAKSILLNNNKL